MKRILTVAILLVAVTMILGVDAGTARAQYPVAVTAYYPSTPVTAYYPVRAGFFGRQVVYRPAVTYAAPVVSAPVTTYYAPSYQVPVTTFYAPAYRVPVRTYYAPAPVTYYSPVIIGY